MHLTEGTRSTVNSQGEFILTARVEDVEYEEGDEDDADEKEFSSSDDDSSESEDDDSSDSEDDD